MNRRRSDRVLADIRCDDCGQKAGSHVPIDRYHSEAATRLLCLGCLGTRRLAGEQWWRK